MWKRTPCIIKQRIQITEFQMKEKQTLCWTYEENILNLNKNLKSKLNRLNLNEST